MSAHSCQLEHCVQSNPIMTIILGGNKKMDSQHTLRATSFRSRHLPKPWSVPLHHQNIVSEGESNFHCRKRSVCRVLVRKEIYYSPASRLIHTSLQSVSKRVPHGDSAELAARRSRRSQRIAPSAAKGKRSNCCA